MKALAVVEAHCISVWWYVFRPEYRCLRDVRVTLPRIPPLALFATATPPVCQAIRK